jgi:hypothetical protein
MNLYHSISYKQAETKYDVKAEREACQWLETLSGMPCQIKPDETLVDVLRYVAELPIVWING